MSPSQDIGDTDIGDNEVHVHMLDAQLPYGYEFYGCDVSLALTPLTDRCFLTLTQVCNFSFSAQLFVCFFLSRTSHCGFVIFVCVLLVA